MECKKCSMCGSVFPSTFKYFRRARGDKLRANCRHCDTLKSIQYRENNKDKVAKYYEKYKAHLRELYKENKKEILKRNKAWRDKNKEYLSDYNKKWREENRDHERQQKREYYLKNKEKILERMKPYGKDYYINNRDRMNMRYHKRTSRKSNLISSFTNNDWKECLDFFDHKDAYTGLDMKTPSQDHIVPLSKGGHYAKWNIVPCDKNINSSKCNKDMEKWFRQQTFFSEERLNKINKWIDLNKLLSNEIGGVPYGK